MWERQISREVNAVRSVLGSMGEAPSSPVGVKKASRRLWEEESQVLSSGFQGKSG